MTSNRQTIRTDVLEKKFSKSQQIQNEPIQKSSPVNYCIVTNFDSNGKTRQWSKMNEKEVIVTILANVFILINAGSMVPLQL